MTVLHLQWYKVFCRKFLCNPIPKKKKKKKKKERKKERKYIKIMGNLKCKSQNYSQIFYDLVNFVVAFLQQHIFKETDLTIR